MPTTGSLLPVPISIVLKTALLACVYSPSGRWEQTGRTAVQTEKDQSHCRELALQETESGGQLERNPFKDVRAEQNCMRGMRYTLK